MRQIRIFLPCLTGARIGALELVEDSEAEWILKKVSKNEQALMLVCGDSLSQGFCAFDSARTYPRILADLLDVELVNHGIGGHVFQAEILEPVIFAGENKPRTPDVVLV